MSPRSFTSVLIANRGEIAVRIIQTCREMGLRSVAVYSEADAAALHVQLADAAYAVGPAPAPESYLDIERILQAARESGAEAVHPGYGFLAENPDFARAVLDLGLVWVGPPPDVIAAMGDKVAAKELARSVGVPVVPGYAGEDGSLERMRREARALGFPVMLKAAAGGGGKGMRRVADEAALPDALEGARREAVAAFGDERVFLEKLIERPRHVEIQVVADSRGAALYLGERDCSMQRRHQKVIEEAPSPALDPGLRAEVGEAAVRFALAGGYVNAGTVEFLLAGRNYYFLEMNTRIQVEHPVTEMVTGFDLIRIQLEIAAGEPVGLSQADVPLVGHAIEARLYAEDPANRFLPTTGTVQLFDPPRGAGVRSDVGIYTGAEVTPYYDPMLAKITVHASTRAAAVARLRRALEECVLLGVTTNLDFLLWAAGHEDFEHGAVDIEWLERASPPAAEQGVPGDVFVAAALWEATTHMAAGSSPRDPFSPWRGRTGWRSSGLESRHGFVAGEATCEVTVVRLGEGRWRSTVDGREETFAVSTGPAGELTLRQGDAASRFRVAGSGPCVWVRDRTTTHALRRDEGTVRRGGIRTAGQQAGPTAPMPGTVVKVAVVPGQLVAAHEPLVVLEAMKMEHVVEAPYAGIVQSILFREGDMVPSGSPLVELEEQ